eukprot:833836-Heterocapsa_arctica.AAC.1
MARFPSAQVLATSSMVPRPWNSASLPPAMATPYLRNLIMSLRIEVRLSLRHAVAHDLAKNSPLRIMLAQIST